MLCGEAPVRAAAYQASARLRVWIGDGAAGDTGEFLSILPGESAAGEESAACADGEDGGVWEAVWVEGFPVWSRRD